MPKEKFQLRKIATENLNEKGFRESGESILLALQGFYTDVSDEKRRELDYDFFLWTYKRLKTVFFLMKNSSLFVTTLFFFYSLFSCRCDILCYYRYK